VSVTVEAGCFFKRGLSMSGIEKLTPRKIARLWKPGKYSDGAGLYLQVAQRGTKSWIFRYERNGKERCMGLGPIHAVGLEEARQAARWARSRLALGYDPLQDRLLLCLGETKAKDKTFDECIAGYIASHRSTWSSEQHARQWERQLKTYISPHLGKIHVLKPIWVSHTETAARLRGRVERILLWATVSGYREGENPARWRGHLQELLPAPAKVKKSHHHASMPYGEIGAFFGRLSACKGIAPPALAFTVLTACRSVEVLKARWDEIDFERATWVIPAARMKARKPHRVPLTPAMLEILHSQQGLHPAWVFPGKKQGRPLCKDALLAVLRRMADGARFPFDLPHLGCGTDRLPKGSAGTCPGARRRLTGGSGLSAI
jgi:integrase